MLLDQEKFIVKAQGKAFSSKKSFEIVDEAGKVLGTAQDTTGFFPGLLGQTTIEVRDVADKTLLFSVSRSGWLMKKDQVLNGQGRVVGRYKAKLFSLSGGFHVYDKKALTSRRSRARCSNPSTSSSRRTAVPRWAAFPRPGEGSPSHSSRAPAPTVCRCRLVSPRTRPQRC